jgi:oligopeptide transport system substrate-binding protein
VIVENAYANMALKAHSVHQTRLSVQSSLRTVTLAVLASLVLGACGDSSSPGAVNLAPTQEVAIPIAHDLGNLDPALAVGEAEIAVDGNVFNGVVRANNAGGSVQPDLALDLPDVSTDGMTYTFHLRTGVHFSNGDPLTAADLVYSWSRTAALQGPDAGIFSGVDGYAATVAAGMAAKLMSGLTATDDHTLEVKLVAPQGYFLDRLASVAAAAVDRKVVATAADPLGRAGDWANHPATLVGTGPYRETVRTAGASVDFAPAAGWWGDPKPVVHLVHLQVAGDVPDPVSSYLTGAYDLVGYLGMEHLSVDALAHLRQSSAAPDLTTVARAATTWVGFNYRQGPFAGRGNSPTKLRQAFALAIDRRQLGDVVCHGSTTCVAATGGLVPPGMRGYAGDGSDALAAFGANEARGLLKQADPDGKATRGLLIDFADTPENGVLFQFLQGQWQKNLGVHVDRRPGHPQTPPGVTPSPLFIERWQARYDDPRDLFAGFFTSGGSANLGGFADAKIDDLNTKADAQSANDSLTSYTSAGLRLQVEAGYIPAYYDSGNLVVRPHLVGASLGAFFDGGWSALQVLQ